MKFLKVIGVNGHTYYVNIEDISFFGDYEKDKQWCIGLKGNGFINLAKDEFKRVLECIESSIFN